MITLEKIMAKHKEYRRLLDVSFNSMEEGRRARAPFLTTKEELEFLVKLEDSKKPRYSNKSKSFNWNGFQINLNGGQSDKFGQSGMLGFFWL